MLFPGYTDLSFQDEARMQKVTKRMNTLEEVNNNVKLLKEMLAHFNREESSEADRELLKVPPWPSLRLLWESVLVYGVPETRVSFESQFIVDNKEYKYGITNNVIFFSRSAPLCSPLCSV